MLPLVRPAILLREPPLTSYDIIPRMAAVAGGMVKGSIDAFIALDTARAREVLLRDDEVDSMKADVTEKLLGFIAADPATVRRARRRLTRG